MTTETADGFLARARKKGYIFCRFLERHIHADHLAAADHVLQNWLSMGPKGLYQHYELDQLYPEKS